MWLPRDEADNFSQKHDAELIKEEKRIEVETQIRLSVDELMRAELKNLKMVCITTLYSKEFVYTGEASPVYTNSLYTVKPALFCNMTSYTKEIGISFSNSRCVMFVPR